MKHSLTIWLGCDKDGAFTLSIGSVDRTAFSGDYFRITGDPDGTPEFAFQALDSRFGDLA